MPHGDVRAGLRGPRPRAERGPSNRRPASAGGQIARCSRPDVRRQPPLRICRSRPIGRPGCRMVSCPPRRSETPPAMPSMPLEHDCSLRPGDRRFAPAHANLASFLAARYLAGLGGRRGTERPHPRAARRAGRDSADPPPLAGRVAGSHFTNSAPGAHRTGSGGGADVRRRAPFLAGPQISPSGRDRDRTDTARWFLLATVSAGGSGHSRYGGTSSEPCYGIRTEATAARPHSRSLPKPCEKLTRCPASEPTCWPRSGIRGVGPASAQRRWALGSGRSKWSRIKNSVFMRFLTKSKRVQSPDPDDDLRGALLDAMYPRFLSTVAAVGLLSVASRPSVFGQNAVFWASLPEKAAGRTSS